MNTPNLFLQSDPTDTPEKGKVHVFRPDHMDDRALWNSFRQGDEAAFVLVFDRSIKALYNYGIRIVNDGDVVKDTVQELFIELWKNRHTLGETDAIRPYLYTSLRRKLMRTKSRKTGKMFVPMPAEYDGELTFSTETSLVIEQTLAEKKQQVMHLLDKLTRRQREAVFLRYFEEMEYDTIARVMELSKQVVYNLVHKAIDSLRKPTR